METKKSLFSLEDYLKAGKPTSFKATLERPEIKSLYGKIKCVYYESGAEYFKEGKKTPQMWKTFYCSEKIFYIEPLQTDIKIEIEPNPTLQLFTKPTFEKKFTKKDAPKEYKSDFDEPLDEISYGKLSDFCLIKGKEYFVDLKTEEISYGPPDESGIRRSSNITFVRISDFPFKGNKPQIPQTPGNKNAIFG